MGTTVPLPLVDVGTPATIPSRLVAVSVVLMGAVAGVGLVALAHSSETVQEPALSAFLACWLTVPYMAAGLMAWRRRPDSRIGPLMITAGLITSLNFTVWSPVPALYTIGAAVQFLPPALFLFVFLAFPSGRVESSVERWIVAAAFVAALLTLPRMLLGEGGSRNLLAIADEPAIVTSLRQDQLILVSGLLLAGTWLLIRHRRHRHLGNRLGLLVAAYSVGLGMIALLYLVQLFSLSGIAEVTRLLTFGVIGLTAILFLVAPLQARLGKAAVGDLVVALGVNPSPSELQAAVAETLRDETIKIAYWLPEFESYADVEGKPVDVEAEPGRSATPVERDGVSVAVLIHDAALDNEPELLSSVAAAIGMTIQNAQLQVELRARLEELRGSRSRILDAEQRERRRLERDLHDGAQQRLVALSLELGELSTRVDDEELLERIEAARREVTASLAELRDVARGIHPASVSDHGLGVALESVATRSPVPVQIIGAPQDRLPEPVELAAFYIVCEALTNVARHAQAASAVVILERLYSMLVIEVIDDGVGGAAADVGTGLRGLADRVEALGGRIKVWSPAGEGTRIRAELPCG